MTPEELARDLEECPNVFVYGTLKRGCGNHRLLTDAQFVTTATSFEPMFDMTDVGFPYAFVGGSSYARGEIYHLGMATEILRRLDRLEGYPHHYDRTIFSFVDDEGTPHLAWMYNVRKTHGGYRGTPVTPDENNVLLWSQR